MITNHSGVGLSMILGITGNYGRIGRGLSETVSHLAKNVSKPGMELIIGFDSESWVHTPFAQIVNSRLHEQQPTVFYSRSDSLLAPIYNKAAELASSRYLLFLWPGCVPKLSSVSALYERAESEGLDWISAVDPRLPSRFGLSVDIIADRFMAYFLSCQNVFSLCQSLIRKETLLDLGGFSTSPILQRDFATEWFHRATLDHKRATLIESEIVSQAWSLDEFPFNKDLSVPKYLSHSFRLRTAADADSANETELSEDYFAIDLPIAEHEFVARLLKRDLPSRDPGVQFGPYKIVVTGGIWEQAHNHLGFYNYFRELETSGLFTYIPLLDLAVLPERDLLSADAVIVSRGRSPRVLRILEYCKLNSIPLIYMIDDNWFSVGTDWPNEYAQIFAPGKSDYEVFIRCLRESDAVIVYNEILGEDVARYSRQVIRLPVNVRSKDFTAPLGDSRLAPVIEELQEWRSGTGGVIVGYVGSPRYSDAAFQAMASIARQRHNQIRVVLFGQLAAGHTIELSSLATTLPYVPYGEYAAAMGRMAPDILVAPLEESRTASSKCPNKYLEYSAAGAAGVYSDVPPYSEIIRSGENGILVATNEVSDWIAAILALVDDSSLRQEIAAAAKSDVVSKYETAVVMPAFIEAILEVILDTGSSDLVSGLREIS